ncbi:MAG: hypothetical protein WAL61_12685, partial [Acidimicrobiales bacterium]
MSNGRVAIFRVAWFAIALAMAMLVGAAASAASPIASLKASAQRICQTHEAEAGFPPPHATESAIIRQSVRLLIHNQGVEDQEYQAFQRLATQYEHVSSAEQTVTQLKVILSHWGTLTHEESQALLEANKLLNRTHGNLTPSQHAQLDALLFKHYGT